MKSISFYILRLIIKWKGVKKLFSETPIDYQTLRKGNIHSPSTKNVLGLNFKVLTIENILVTEIVPNQTKSDNLILYCPGGSFVSGPNDFNWKSIAHIVKETGVVGYMIDYPKAPEHQIEEINTVVDVVYNHFAKIHHAKNIILLGGSVGGTLMTLLVQRLIKKQFSLPKQLILITPVMDCSMTNLLIKSIEEKDIMNSKKGIVSAHQMCAGNIDLRSTVISPLYGEVRDFVPTLIFIAENDIQRPDAELFCAKLIKQNINLEVEFGKDMPHIYPLLPISEGKSALFKIINSIKSNS